MSDIAAFGITVSLGLLSIVIALSAIASKLNYIIQALERITKK